MKQRRPGLVDLQANGFAGIDFNTPGHAVEQIDGALDAMRATGVTRCLPTIITCSADYFARCVAPLVASQHPGMAGIHLEGPYISPVDGPRGAHQLPHVEPPTIDDFRRRQDAAEGKIRIVTLAPEVPGALPLIEYLVANNVVAAIGHSAASAQDVADAARAGATMSTHLGNGCHGQMDRHHNVLWPQIADDRLQAALIVDGHHLPPAFVQTVVKAKTAARCLLVTDAVAAAAAPAGRYTLADFAVERAENGRVTAVGATHLAGSSLTMDDAVARTCAWLDWDLDAVWPLASTQPAAAIGLTDIDEIDIEWHADSHQLTILPSA